MGVTRTLVIAAALQLGLQGAFGCGQLFDRTCGGLATLPAAVYCVGQHMISQAPFSRMLPAVMPGPV